MFLIWFSLPKIVSLFFFQNFPLPYLQLVYSFLIHYFCPLWYNLFLKAATFRSPIIFCSNYRSDRRSRCSQILAWILSHCSLPYFLSIFSSIVISGGADSWETHVSPHGERQAPGNSLYLMQDYLHSHMCILLSTESHLPVSNL